MNLDENEIREAGADPERLEQLYRSAVKAGQGTAFASAVQACYAATPDNVLYAAWFYRLHAVPETSAAAPVQARPGPNWALAVPLSIVTGLIFWALSDFEGRQFTPDVPWLFLWWAPIATAGALAYLALTARRALGRALAVGLGLLALTAAVELLVPRLDYPDWLGGQAATVAAIHIPLLCWVGLGIAVLGLRSSTEDRFAFLIKSIEVAITAGLFLIAGMVFGGITVGLFAALAIELPELVLRLISVGGLGLLPVLAVATMYDPRVRPAEQDFDQGLSKFVATLVRLLLPLTLAVLVIYVCVIPFAFMEPFRDRDVLIVYNLMLFAILGLLLGATPLRAGTVSPRLQRVLRGGIVAVAGLTVLVSLYALSATVTRTVLGGWTLNRLTIIGWNTINIAILGLLLVQQSRAGAVWGERLQRVFSLATNAYAVWPLLLVLVVPLLF